MGKVENNPGERSLTASPATISAAGSASGQSATSLPCRTMVWGQSDPWWPYRNRAQLGKEAEEARRGGMAVCDDVTACKDCTAGDKKVSKVYVVMNETVVGYVVGQRMGTAEPPCRPGVTR